MTKDFKTSQVIVFNLNKDLQIENVSENINNIFGYKSEELVGKEILDISYHEDKPKLKSRLDYLVKNGSDYENWELRKQKKDGEIVWVREFIQITKYKDNVDEIKVCCTDVTEQKMIEQKLFESEKKNRNLIENSIETSSRKHYEEELLKAKIKAEESDKLKSQFLAQISHEIRSPIHTILSFSSLIHEDIKDSINDEIECNFKIINSAGQRMTRTIDLILNMSEIQTGTYDYTPRNADIYSEILTSLIDEAKATSKNKDVKFNVNKSTDDTIRNVDTYTISQIFVNLLENAFKYTKKGSIELGIHANKDKALEISVTDTGIGIAEEYIPKLFEPFSQEEQGYTRTFEGNGLGLALVKNYCAMNKAEIEVESEKGIGTTFRVIFQNK